MKHVQPAWLDKALFPFDSHWINIDGHELHYIDEGSGEVLLFVHGTPEWSFGFRDLIKSLRTSFRCVAIDLLGFGLSEKPKHGDYTCKHHAARLETFINTLHLDNISLVANDFGGGIGLSYAINNPGRMKNIILFNTWMWSLKQDKHYARPARIMNTFLGKFLYLKTNFPVNVIMPAAFGNKKLLTKPVHAHYKKALPPGERFAPYAFAKEILEASDWWDDLWRRLPVLTTKPFLFFWGMKDAFILPGELEKWTRAIPQGTVITFSDAGHFVQEEKPHEMIAAIRTFMTEESFAVSGSKP
jgi:pimeloyl-ACP methyl ester carboxylesterase